MKWGRVSEAGGDLGSGAPGRENCELLSRCSRKSKEASDECAVGKEGAGPS